MDAVTEFLAKFLAPFLRPVSRWLLSPERVRPTWHFETAFVALVLVSVASVTSPSIQSLSDPEYLKSFLVIWLSVGAVLGSFLHAKVGYRMAEALAAQQAPTSSCYEWSGKYWLSKEILWFLVFLISGAYPAIAGTIIFILYPAWRKIHVTERARVREAQ